MINHELTLKLQTWAKSNPLLCYHYGLCTGIISVIDKPIFCAGNLQHFYPFFSGDTTYPVLHPDMPAEEGYNCTHNEYEGVYGFRRLQLFQGLATAEVHEIGDQQVVKLTKLTSPNRLPYRLVDDQDVLLPHQPQVELCLITN